jgi:hypothetical protein
VHQFALKTGVPHFCHVSDVGKTVSFILQHGKIVHPIFRRQLSSHDHDCDSRERSADEMACTGDALTDIAEDADQRKALPQNLHHELSQILSDVRVEREHSQRLQWYNSASLDGWSPRNFQAVS